MTVIHADEVAALGIARVIERIREVVARARPTSPSISTASIRPSRRGPEPRAGGLSTREAMELLRGCAGLDIVGGDVVEVAPQYDATTNTAQAAAQMLFEILTLVALTRKRPA